MAILTENNIRKLLRTTNLKETKVLVLEPGTIITPSAKSYLTDVKVIYEEQSDPVPVEKAEEPVVCQAPIIRDESLLHPQFSLNWKIKVEQVIGEVLYAQQISLQQQNRGLITELDSVLNVLQDFRQLRFYENDSVHYQMDPGKYPQADFYSSDTFLPNYTDGEVALMVYRLYTQIRNLQVEASNFQTCLPFEEYYRLIKACRFLADYVWMLMIQEIEESNKGRSV